MAEIPEPIVEELKAERDKAVAEAAALREALDELGSCIARGPHDDFYINSDEKALAATSNAAAALASPGPGRDLLAERDEAIRNAAQLMDWLDDVKSERDALLERVRLLEEKLIEAEKALRHCEDSGGSTGGYVYTHTQGGG